MEVYVHADTTKRILGAAFEVHGILGPGFLESVYEQAMAKELHRRSIPFQRQVVVPVGYKGEIVGSHRLDLLVEDCVIVELKTVKDLAEIHTAITLSYLAATGLSVALLLNFAKPSLEYRRVARKGKPSSSA